MGLSNFFNAQIQLQRDASFGNNGIFTYNQGNTYGAEIFVQDDNSLLLTNIENDLLPNRYVVKINQNGILDNSFAQNGYLQLDNNADTFHSLLQGLEGKFYINYADPYVSVAANNRIISYNPNGTINTSFSNNGVFTYNFSIIEGYFTSTEDGGLLVTKYDGFTKYLQTGNTDPAVGNNGVVAFNNSNYPSLEPIATKGNKLFFDNYGETKRVDVHGINVVEKQQTSIYANPIVSYENYRTKAKNNYGLYYFRFTHNPQQPSIFTGIRLLKTDENLVASPFGSNPYIDLPLNPNVYNGNNTDIIYTPNGNYLIFGVKSNFESAFLAYNETGNQVTVNSQQFFTDSGISANLSNINLYSKGDTIYMVGVAGNNISVIKYKITETQSTLSASENITDHTIAVNNPFDDSITVKDDKNSIFKMNLYNYSGALILSTHEKKMSTSHIPKGNYILNITTKKGDLIHKKLIKIKD
jgi:hypothetical protein